MKPTFNSTIDILVKAYLNNTLEHGNCAACAVGNLIAHSIGAKPKMMAELNDGDNFIWSNNTYPRWLDVFVTPRPRAFQQVNEHMYIGDAKDQIDITGYTWQQLAKIEHAFERGNTSGHYSIEMCEAKDNAMFNGLMEVLEVLAEIHGINLEAKEEAKKLFVKI